MTTPKTMDQPGISLVLPVGFFELPAVEVDEEVFRSPDDPRRPIMVLVNVYYVESGQSSVNAAIAGLEEVHRQAGGSPEIADLPAGRAVITTSRKPSSITVNEEAVEIVQHSIVAWIPNSNGKGMAGVAISSNNSEDWSHVEDLARGLFETFEWEDPAESTEPESQPSAP